MPKRHRRRRHSSHPLFWLAGLRAKLKATRIAKLDCPWLRTPNAISLHPRRGGKRKFPGSFSGPKYSPAAGDSPLQHLSIELRLLHLDNS